MNTLKTIALMTLTAVVFTIGGYRSGSIQGFDDGFSDGIHNMNILEKELGICESETQALFEDMKKEYEDGLRDGIAIEQEIRKGKL